MHVNNLFQLKFPDEWKETTVHSFEGPHDSGVQHNLVLVITPDVHKEMTAARFAKDQLEEVAKALPGFELLSQNEETLPSGMKVCVSVYRYMPSDELTLFQKQYHILAGGKAYSFTSTFSKKTLKTVANEVDRIVASLRIPQA